MPSKRKLRNLASIVVLIAGLVLCALLARHVGEHRETAAHQAQLAQQLRLYARGLEQLIDRYRALPQVLALDPELRAALQGPLDDAARQRINLRLEAASRTTRASTLTLIDRNGVALAASNWESPGSNVGQRYGFRPYVQQALAQGHGRFYGIGITTGVPGYFLSEAVRDASGRPVGVVVIKIDLAALEREWLRVSDTVLVSDEYGVTFLASRPEWRYRMLRPLDAQALARIAATRKYAGQRLLPYRTSAEDAPGASALLRITEPAMAGVWMHEELQLPSTGWTLHLLHDADGIAAAGMRAAIAAAIAWLALAFLLLFMRQRLHTATLRKRSRTDMEHLVEQHAREMRTARDALLDAAQHADTGLSRQLEHLPQGVVIIDADLNLVAWNSRYVELFRFPPHLLRVGTPIESLFRYNARRGLLGTNPTGDAIARRLAHLRSGKPHQHESEKDDGTVLEIRGNPLPEGGFVTSYADITSYKATARELRSLADALEARVEQRTHDLEQARREAVEANRYKTRFVAAAVHDLLQPLNAARVFMASLRRRLDPAAGTVADHIDRSLSALDTILASLLDLSRLEAGTLPLRVRDIPLEPMLSALAAQFGALAQTRGLRLEYVPTRAVVRTDPDLLRRILQNLLSNAVRYTREGRVVLGCRRAGDAVRIEVHDSGPGIPAAQQREIFEEFRRLDNDAGNERGAGLGLAFVEHSARLLGHPIGLHSRVGAGSVFWIRVPLGDAHAAAALPEPALARHDDDRSLLHAAVVWWIGAPPAEPLAGAIGGWGCELHVFPDPAAACADTAASPRILLVEAGACTGGEAAIEALRSRFSPRPQVIVFADADDAPCAAVAARHGWSCLPLPIRLPALRALMTQRLLRG